MAKRMTVVFDDERLYTALKVAAARLGCPAKDIVAGAVRDWLEAREDEELAGELADHLRRLLCEPDLRRQLGTQAKERARVFDIGRTVEDTQAVYSELLAGG